MGTTLENKPVCRKTLKRGMEGTLQIGAQVATTMGEENIQSGTQAHAPQYLQSIQIAQCPPVLITIHAMPPCANTKEVIEDFTTKYIYLYMFALTPIYCFRKTRIFTHLSTFNYFLFTSLTKACTPTVKLKLVELNNKTRETFYTCFLDGQLMFDNQQVLANKITTLNN